MISTASVSQQYLLASKARSKLMKCANSGKNKDYDLRVLVGHANMLDRLMENIERFNSKDTANMSGSYGVEYISSDEDSDEENKVLSSDSSSDDEVDDEYSSDSDYSDNEEEVERRYTPLGVMGSTHDSAVVTVTIDHCLEDSEEDYESDSESDVDEHGFEMDLSMMPLTFKSRDGTPTMGGQVAFHEPITV